VSLVDLAYEKIRQRILDNEYQPAHQILEHELAAALGMSRTPVREALVRLQNEGFIQLVPRHGMRVVPLSLADLRDMYEVLTALEVTAVERLVQSGRPEEVLAPLDQAVDEMDQALASGNNDAWVRADERFHRTLIELSGNSRLAALAFSVWDQGHRARMMTVHFRSSLQQSNQEHRALVDAIRRRDLAAARAQHIEHRARASREIVKVLEQTRYGSF
jgi:DNA-binding GntR family transcriptional regulator